MAKKVILKDLNDIEVLPITRGELVLDASGNPALHSTLFLATDSLPGLMSSEDKYKLDNLEDSGPGANNKVAQINTTTNDVYRLLFSETADDTDRTEKSRKSANLTFNPSTGVLNLTGAINANGGTLTISSYEDFIIKRNVGGSFSGITYSNADEVALGYIGIGGALSTYPYQPMFVTREKESHKIWHSGNDGHNSGLDADTLDGYHVTHFMSYVKGSGYVEANLLNSELWNVAGGDGYIEYYDNGTWFNSRWGKVLAHYGFDGDLRGNASSATKLQTARTIWGLPFDGTANVDGILKMNVNVTAASVASSALQINNTGTYAGPRLINAYSPNLPVSSSEANGVHLMFGVTDTSYNAAYIKFWYAGAGSTNNAIRFGFHTSDNLMSLLANGNVGIGTNIPSRKLDVQGDAKVCGTLHVGYTLPGRPSASTLGNALLCVGNFADKNRTTFSYGTAFWTEGNGYGYILQGRGDGTASTYPLILQVFGGNVGIGVSPSYKFDVHSTSTTASYDLHYYNSNKKCSLFVGSDLFWYGNAKTSNSSIFNVQAGTTSDGSGGKSVFKILGDGNVIASTFVGNLSGKASTANMISHSTYYYSNNVMKNTTTAKTIFGDIATENYLFPSFMEAHPKWSGYADVINFTGYCMWGGTQFATEYNAINPRVAIRKYNQSRSNWGDWTEFITEKNNYKVRDSGNSNEIAFYYSTGGFTSNPSWLAAWNGYKLTYVSPSVLDVNYASKSTYLYACDSYAYGGSNPYYMKMRYNINGDNRWYLSVYPETPKTVAVDYAYSAGNADSVDGQHFNWNNNKNDHTYIWAASSNGQAYLVHRASMSVNYASSAGNADTVDSLHASAFMRAVNANSYYGLAEPGGGTSNWIRTTVNGLIPYQSGGHGSLGTSSWPFSTVYANNFYGYLNGNISGTAASARDMGLTTITKSIRVTTSWLNTGITGANIGTGSFVVLIVNINDNTNGGLHWYETYTGLMSSYAGTTNSTVSDEIPLHRAGHTPVSSILYLRTLRLLNSGYVQLLIAGNYNMSAAQNITFKFRRII